MGWICKHIYRLMVTIITTRLVGKAITIIITMLV